jgi:hypothetical protein
MGNIGSFPGDKATRAWSWPLTSISCRGKECVELYLHCPVRLHILVLSYKKKKQGYLYLYITFPAKAWYSLLVTFCDTYQPIALFGEHATLNRESNFLSFLYLQHRSNETNWVWREFRRQVLINTLFHLSGSPSVPVLRREISTKHLKQRGVMPVA